MEIIIIDKRSYEVVEVFPDGVLVQDSVTKSLFLLPFFLIENEYQPEIKLTSNVVSLRGFICRKKTSF